MSRQDAERGFKLRVVRAWNVTVAALCLSLVLVGPASFSVAEQPPSTPEVKVLADTRLEEPLTAIIKEYSRLTGSPIGTTFLPASAVGDVAQDGGAGYDVVICMPADDEGKTAVSSLPGAKAVVWKHPSATPVWAAVLNKQAGATAFFDFLGGPTGHRLWAESEGGFVISIGKTRAEAYQWIVENRIKHTYAMTAMRMLGECGGIREGICIDVGCGSGNLAIELAKRSNFTIIGLDIDPDVKPLFLKNVREAGLEKRISFVLADAQEMPFAKDYADLIVSRGTLVFIPDIKRCLREVDRVLKPTGVAFLGGRYVYTPRTYKLSTEELKKIVREAGIPNAEVIEARGQWVKIIGPEAPKAAREFQGSPKILAGRLVADYGITKGRCLLLCASDGGLEQALQKGLVESTELKITALYPTEKAAKEAEKRIRSAGLTGRIVARAGKIDSLPFDEGSFDLVAGVGPILIWEKDRQKAMCEIQRVLRLGGAALVGGRYVSMPAGRRVSSEALREDAAKTGLPGIRVFDDMGQWIEIRKGVNAREFPE
jgi:ubiquinone/menaquinone biosynthesis C-methylase UbiE